MMIQMVRYRHSSIASTDHVPRVQENGHVDLQYAIYTSEDKPRGLLKRAVGRSSAPIQKNPEKRTWWLG